METPGMGCLFEQVINIKVHRLSRGCQRIIYASFLSGDSLIDWKRTAGYTLN